MLTLYLLGCSLLAGVAYALGRRDGLARGALLGRLSFYEAAAREARAAGDADSAEAAQQLAAAARRALRRP